MGVEQKGECLPHMCKDLGLSLRLHQPEHQVSVENVLLGTGKGFLTYGLWILRDSESLCIHLSDDDIKTLSVDAEHSWVHSRLATENIGTLHFCPLGACSKDGDSICMTKVEMTIFATLASLPLGTS